MEWRAEPGAYAPKLFANGATSVPGLYAAGSAAGVPSHDLAHHAEGIAEAVAGGGNPSENEPAPPPDGRPNELLGYYRELLATRGHGRWTACPCVDVLVSEVENAVRSGYRGIEVIKRYTSLGTGICQGRYCLPDALLVLSLLEGRPPAEVGYITQRPPVVPTPLAVFASLPSPPAEVVVP